mmetsp:Transcript_74985/g.223460  ORF Transcript_74985/g.223460 Transcript_74985/m.223460 type:complete len:206 (-) Transcript_74985:433-1050(-)
MDVPALVKRHVEEAVVVCTALPQQVHQVITGAHPRDVPHHDSGPGVLPCMDPLRHDVELRKVLPRQLLARRRASCCRPCRCTSALAVGAHNRLRRALGNCTRGHGEPFGLDLTRSLVRRWWSRWRRCSRGRAAERTLLWHYGGLIAGRLTGAEAEIGPEPRGQRRLVWLWPAAGNRDHQALCGAHVVELDEHLLSGDSDARQVAE